LKTKPLAADLDDILRHTQGLWEELRGQRLFITGGTGFFGSWLLESFAHANEQLGLQARAVVLTRNRGAFAVKAPHLVNRPDLEFVAGDVRNFPFAEGAFSHVIHAGATSGAPVEHLEMFATIVDGTRRVLEFAATHGTRKLLLVSSGAVYGRQPSDLTHVPEDYPGAPDPLDPASAYAEGKRAAELLCALASRNSGLEIKIARCFAFVGPHLPLDAHFAVGNFIRDALCGGPIRVNGDGTPHRSYLCAADLAVWLWTILFRGHSARAYNVGSEADISIRELAQAVRDSVTPPPRIQIARAPDPAQPASRYVPATHRARSELGLRESVDLRDGLRRTILWHRERRDR
jgi:nucleoside-diphosphate-sugar epimerase